MIALPCTNGSIGNVVDHKSPVSGMDGCHYEALDRYPDDVLVCSSVKKAHNARSIV